MAKTVVRKNLKQFGVNGNSNNFGQFGSVNAGSPLKTKDINTIQALSAWLTGWQDAVIDSNKAPYLEDMNSAMFVLFYELFYTLQEGLPEWDVATTYFIGSMVRKPGTAEIYYSIIDDNVGNALPSATDNGSWHFMYPVRMSDLIGQIVTAQITDANVTDAKILSMAATKLTGLIQAAQINTVDLVQITGSLPKFIVSTNSATPTLTGDGTLFVPHLVHGTTEGCTYDETTGLLTIGGSAGWWHMSGKILFLDNNSGASEFGVIMYKNGDIIDRTVMGIKAFTATPRIIPILVDTFRNNEAGDIIQIKAYASGGTKNVGLSGGTGTDASNHFKGIRLFDQLV